MSYIDFSVLKGLTLKSITGMESQNDEIIFKTECGRVFKMYHEQDCCENVYLEDVMGDVNDLIGHPILLAEESTNDTVDSKGDGSWGDFLWTFYKLATIKGYVDLRWYGSSNGYYSISVSFVEL